MYELRSTINAMDEWKKHKLMIKFQRCYHKVILDHCNLFLHFMCNEYNKLIHFDFIGSPDLSPKGNL